MIRKEFTYNHNERHWKLYVFGVLVYSKTELFL